MLMPPAFTDLLMGYKRALILCWAVSIQSCDLLISTLTRINYVLAEFMHTYTLLQGVAGALH
jgi:hypothetical protein